ncbi:MAG TPA: Ig-like domain-containing protein [Candidatus Angelobacter sp.]|nr:Ig-like domain-containing protein [Candidatus Angelobacter sp.]
MKKAVRLVCVTMILAAASFAGVTVSSPLPGTTSASPVHFVASASSSFPITAMRIYVDNVSLFAINAANMDTFVPLSTGNHFVVVQAWDSTGAVFKSPENITVTTPPAGVAVSSPANGATVSSPLQVVASATAPNPIVAMRIYLDDVSVFAINASSLNTTVSAATTGSHRLVVQAWDSTGVVYKQPVNITVSTVSNPVPPNATTFSQIEDMSGWENCTVCAGAGGNGTLATFSMVQNQSSPSLDGNSARFSIGGSTPYSDALWWKQLGGNNAARNFRYDVDFYLTAPQFAQALEFDVNQSDGAHKFIFGTQCNIRDGGVWDVWTGTGMHWLHTGIACAMPAAFTWHHLTWELQRSDTQATFIALTLDGVKNYVNMSFDQIPSGVHEINVAFQMDGDFAQHAYSAWLDNVTLSYW